MLACYHKLTKNSYCSCHGDHAPIYPSWWDSVGIDDPPDCKSNKKDMENDTLLCEPPQLK